MTTWLNLMEVYYALLRDGETEAKARGVVQAGRGYLLEFSLEDVLDAMALRHRWRRRGKAISYVDAIGFHLAQKHGLAFLTGDPAFRRIHGVTFVRSRATREGGPSERV